MQKVSLVTVSLLTSVFLAGCAVPQKPLKTIDQAVTPQEQQVSQQQQLVAMKPTLKRKIALARVTNETQYGRSFLRDSQGDVLGKQLTDMMSKALVESGQFVVLERPDLGRLIAENKFAGGDFQKVGADVLLLGSLTEFGRKTDGQSGFLSKTKRQMAVAKMDVRLVDVSSGRVIFATSGAGQASNESGNVLGWGSRATYDGSLNDKAINNAISEVISGIVSKLSDQPWKTYVLNKQGGTVVIAGGERQGLNVGDEFVVKTKGKKIKNPQTGFWMNLPGDEVAKIRVVKCFGTSEVDEGAVCQIVSGSLKHRKIEDLIVVENSKD